MAVGDGVVWSESLPDNSTLAHQIDDYNRDVRIGVRARMAREHIWTSSQTATNEGGHHNFITLQMQTAAPAMAGTSGGALWVGTDKAFYFTDSTGNNTIIVPIPTTTSPSYYFSMNGTTGASWAPLHIHSTTADPASPVVGQMWYRSDL